VKDPLARLRKQFDRAYKRLSQTGQADEYGSFEYARVFDEWRQHNCPTDVRAFIIRQANLPAQS
jgi:hypothetical protein